MIDWIKSFFGKGRVRVEFEGIDRNGKIVSGDAKVPYVGKWDEDAMMKFVKDKLMYEKGVVVTKMELVAHVPE